METHGFPGVFVLGSRYGDLDRDPDIETNEVRSRENGMMFDAGCACQHLVASSVVADLTAVGEQVVPK